MVPTANVQTTASNGKQYLCLLSLVTAGLLDDEMGSDEQEIIEMISLIVDVDQKTVRSEDSLYTSHLVFLHLW